VMAVSMMAELQAATGSDGGAGKVIAGEAEERSAGGSSPLLLITITNY